MCLVEVYDSVDFGKEFRQVAKLCHSISKQKASTVWIHIEGLRVHNS